MPTPSFLVAPPEVRATSSVVDQCGSALLDVRGSFGALAANPGCAGVAAEAFQQLSHAWLAELAGLSTQTGSLAAQLAEAAADYERADHSVFAVPGSQR